MSNVVTYKSPLNELSTDNSWSCIGVGKGESVLIFLKDLQFGGSNSLTIEVYYSPYDTANEKYALLVYDLKTQTYTPFKVELKRDGIFQNDRCDGGVIEIPHHRSAGRIWFYTRFDKDIGGSVQLSAHPELKTS